MKCSSHSPDGQTVKSVRDRVVRRPAWELARGGAWVGTAPSEDIWHDAIESKMHMSCGLEIQCMVLTPGRKFSQIYTMYNILCNIVYNIKIMSRFKFNSLFNG